MPDSAIKPKLNSGEFLVVHHTVAQSFEVRQAKRLTNIKHELKLWELSIDQIHQMAEYNFRKDLYSLSNPFSNATPKSSTTELTNDTKKTERC